MIRRLVEGAERRRTLVLLLCGALALSAAAVGPRLRLDALPDVTSNQVVVLTRAPGLSPGEVEQRITRPVETALGGIPGLVQQRSTSRYGISSVTAVFSEDVSAFEARQWIAGRLQAIGSQLPAGVEPPELAPPTGGLGEIYHFALSSPSRSGSELLELATLRIAPLLRQVEGVVEVNTWGGTQRTLAVTVDPSAMARHHRTLDDLRQALARSVDNVAGAALPAGADDQTLVRGTSRPRVAADLGGVLLPDPSAPETVLRVGDVASVQPGGSPRLGAATRDGQGEIVYVMVQMLRGDNALRTVARIREQMPAVRSAVPTDVSIDVVYDRGVLVGQTLHTLGTNLAEGALLVIAVLFVMLGSFRAGLLIALTIPLSMLGALVGMVVFDIPGNLMSLGAIDFGLIVDGGVVMMEGIFHRFHHEPPAESARRSTIREVTGELARPVLVSVGIIVLVYAPVLTLSGVDGKLFRPMALTVVMALLTSLVLSLFVVPAAASLFLRTEHVPRGEPWLVRVAHRMYEPALDRAMRRPGWVGGVALSTLALGAVLFVRAGSEFVPQLDEGDLVVQTTQQPSVGIEAAIQRATVLERTLRELPEVRQVVSRIGSPAVATDLMGLEQADVFVALRDKSEFRPGKDKLSLIEEMGRRLAERLPDTEIAFTQPIQMRFNELLGGSTSDVTLAIYGQDLATLERLAAQARGAVEQVTGAADVRIEVPPGVPLLSVTPEPLLASAHGLDTGDVLDAVQALRRGLPATTTYDDAVQIPILVHLPPPASSVQADEALLPTPRGELVELQRVARLERSTTPSVITRNDAQRRIVVGFNVRGSDLEGVVERARATLARDVQLPAGYRFEWGGQLQSLEQAQGRLSLVIPGVLLLVIGILAWMFRHALPAGLIFLNVPIAGVGGVLSLVLRDMPISISAMVGLIVLAGIAVLNGVVLMSQIERLRAEGSSPHEAAREAALKRMRPVLMTALVAALGFVPMMFATGVGAEVQRPLATVVVGGLVTSTLLTLLVLPALYGRLRAAPRR